MVNDDLRERIARWLGTRFGDSNNPEAWRFFYEHDAPDLLAVLGEQTATEYQQVGACFIVDGFGALHPPEPGCEVDGCVPVFRQVTRPPCAECNCTCRICAKGHLPPPHASHTAACGERVRQVTRPTTPEPTIDYGDLGASRLNMGGQDTTRTGAEA